MKIGIDLDGCAYGFTESFKEYLIEIGHPGAVDLMVPTANWEIWLDWGMELAAWLSLFTAGVAAGRIFRTGEPLDGAKEAMDYLRGRGHSLHVVTHRDIHPRAVQSTCEWLAEWGLHYDTITFSKDKTVIPVDVFIEDNVDNALALADAGVLVALMDRPWNQHAPKDRYEIDRVYGWHQFALAVDRLERKIQVAA